LFHVCATQPYSESSIAFYVPELTCCQPDAVRMEYPIPYLWQFGFSYKKFDYPGLNPSHDTHLTFMLLHAQRGRRAIGFNHLDSSNYDKRLVSYRAPSSRVHDEVMKVAEHIYYLNPPFDEDFARSSSVANHYDSTVHLQNDWARISQEHSVAVLARAILESSTTIRQVLPVRLEYAYDRDAKSPLRARTYFGLLIHAQQQPVRDKNHTPCHEFRW
jgi:hypothetical protein